MKKIVFENTYKCDLCQRNFYGHINKCPICKQKGKKISENEFVTFIKGIKNDYHRPKNT